MENRFASVDAHVQQKFPRIFMECFLLNLIIHEGNGKVEKPGLGGIFGTAVTVPGAFFREGMESSIQRTRRVYPQNS